MTADQAADYHAWQIGVLASEGAERVTALTLSYPEEAIGVVQAGVAAGVPVVAAFTVETDGRLPDGTALADAIAAGRRSDRRGCRVLHGQLRAPDPHRRRASTDPRRWTESAACGSTRRRSSHAELDEAEELDEGDPAALARTT